MKNMNNTLEQILNLSADAEDAPANGPFGTGNQVLEQTLRDFIQLQSKQISVGTQIVGSRTVPWLDFKWYTGANGKFEFPIDDGAVTDPTNIGASNYSVQLEKGQGRTVFMDTVRLRGETWENIDRQQLAIVRALAEVTDNDILTKVLAGAGVTKAATALFGASTADEEGDLLSAMDLIYLNGRVSGDEGLSLVLPAEVRSSMLNTQLFGNVVESLQEHLNRVANLTVFYSRDHTGGYQAPSNSSAALGTSAILMVPGAETAEHFTYNGPGFQETELTRLPGVGFDWLLTGFMGTVIHEHQDGAASGKNNRICSITDVIA